MSNFQNPRHYRYQLSKRGKIRCPQCGRRTFVPYIDTSTGRPLDESVGKCDRADNCAHHYTPREFFRDHPDRRDGQPIRELYRPAAKPPPPSLINPDAMRATVRETCRIWSGNNFVRYLCSLFGADTAAKLVAAYRVGTFTPTSWNKGSEWNNSTVFWEIDAAGGIRHGKAMRYAVDGHRMKDGKQAVTSYQSEMRSIYPNFNLVQCFYGEHLLQLPENRNKPVAIVESEKSAIIASAVFPQYVWLSAGSCNGLNQTKFAALRGRRVFLFPDVGKFEEWERKAAEFWSYDVKVAEWTRGAELPSGYDIADAIEAGIRMEQAVESVRFIMLGAPWEKYGLPY